MLLTNPRDVVWDLVPYDFRLSDESLAWLRRHTWGDCSLDDDEDSAPSPSPQPVAGNSCAVTPLRGAV